ncbi:MAG: hypothetical protein IKN04_11040 [Clostridia bacterium]|nr:hypothetical protein [Clostridia bacterium]
MSTEWGLIISAVSLLIAFLSFYRSGRKDDKSDAAADAAANARIETKLDGIQSGVDDVRVEMRTMRAKVDDHAERLAKVEARASSNSHRIDTLEKVIKEE